MSGAPKQDHTPTPWTLESREAGIWLKGPGGESIALVIRAARPVLSPEDDAEFILAAVNAHASLVAALRKVPLFRIVDSHLGYECCGCGRFTGIDREGNEIDQDCAPDCYVPIVEAALAGAQKGESRD